MRVNSVQAPVVVKTMTLKLTKSKTQAGKFGLGSIFVVCAIAVSGCTGSSTYGTGVSQEQALVDDLTGIFGQKEKPKITYTERPGIVKPKTVAALPAPTDGSATTAAWPESPEQRLARLREDLASEDAETRAQAKRSLLIFDQTKRDNYDARQAARLEQLGISKKTASMTPEERRAFIAAYRRNNPNNITGTKRRYLSEPPTEYRTPAESAGYGDLGLTEKQKRECLKDKGSRGVLKSLRRAAKKDDICKNYLASLNLVEPEKKN